MAFYERFTVGLIVRGGRSNSTVIVEEYDELNLVTKCHCATASIPSAAAGYAMGCKLTDSTTGLLYVNIGSTSSCVFTPQSPLQITIADPGDAAAIPVTNSGSVSLVTAGAETRTIAAPTFIGQELLLSGETLVGNCVVTVATTVNQTGNNTITFANAGDSILLVAKANGANLRWSAVGTDGAALSTV